MNRIIKLERQGYRFAGIYTTDREEAKQRAAEERAKGNRARVVERRGRRMAGYSVYVKKSEENVRKEAIKALERNVSRLKGEVVKKTDELADLKHKLAVEEETLAGFRRM